jgi:hypothetical protein
MPGEVIHREYIDGHLTTGASVRLAVGYTDEGGIMLGCPDGHEAIVSQQSGLDLSAALRRAVTEASLQS